MALGEAFNTASRNPIWELSNGRDKNTGGMEKNIVKQETYLFYKDPIDVVEAFPL